MTIFELFPWFVAIGVTVLSAALLANKFGLNGLWAWMIGLILGIACWVSYWLAVKTIGLHFAQRKAEKEELELAKRTYYQFQAANNYSAAKNLYYECIVCGNVIPSASGKEVSCKCRNLTVDASGHPTVQNHQKIKVFSMPK